MRIRACEWLDWMERGRAAALCALIPSIFFLPRPHPPPPTPTANAMAPSTAVATVTRVPTVNTTTESLQLVRERSTVHAPVEHASCSTRLHITRSHRVM